MGTTGLIFAGIAIAWLAYLVPHFVRRREGEPDVEREAVDPFSDSVRILRHGTAPLLDQDLAELREFEVSTPVTRRAAVTDLRRLERVAASRRRRVLSGLFAVLCAVVSVCSMSWLPWWTVAVPAGLVLLFVVVSRVSVRAMRRDLDARYVAISRGSDEKTVMISRKDAAEGRDKQVKGKKATKAAKDADGKPGLWDPLPITVPTYVSKPLAPRTVRTIDLSAPDVTSSGRQSIPVTADAREETVAEPGEAQEQDGGSRAASA
ncbi:MAG: divisome protein SepX/GlpR [Janthinobacterium lividum]